MVPQSSSWRFASFLRSSSISVASLLSSSHAVHTARVATCGGFTPSSSTACSMRFTPRAPPAPTAASAISPAVSTTSLPLAYAPGGGRPSDSPDAAGRDGFASLIPPAPCSSPISSGATLARTASSLCALNTAPARALSALASADRRASIAFTSSRIACSSRSSALVRSIWSLRACLRSISCCASNGSRMIGCVAASSGSSARASTSLRATA